MLKSPPPPTPPPPPHTHFSPEEAEAGIEWLQPLSVLAGWACESPGQS